MYLAIEAICDGTWASGPWPEEVAIVDLLLETGWSWDELQRTPHYIQRVTIDLIQGRRRAEQDAVDRQRREAGRVR